MRGHRLYARLSMPTPAERAPTINAAQTSFTLDAEDWQTFMAQLDRPAQVIPAVADLLRRPRPE